MIGLDGPKFPCFHLISLKDGSTGGNFVVMTS